MVQTLSEVCIASKSKKKCLSRKEVQTFLGEETPHIGYEEWIKNLKGIKRGIDQQGELCLRGQKGQI